MLHTQVEFENLYRDSHNYDFHHLNLLTSFVSECLSPSDCPNGGTNYQCNANMCECPFPMVLDGDNCVGTSPFRKDILHKENFLLR